MAQEKVLSRLIAQLFKCFKVSSKAVVTKKMDMTGMTFSVSLNAVPNSIVSRPFQATFKTAYSEGRCTYVVLDSEHGICKMGFYPRQWSAFQNGERNEIQGSFVFRKRGGVKVMYVAVLSYEEATESSTSALAGVAA